MREVIVAVILITVSYVKVGLPVIVFTSNKKVLAGNLQAVILKRGRVQEVVGIPITEIVKGAVTITLVENIIEILRNL